MITKYMQSIQRYSSKKSILRPMISTETTRQPESEDKNTVSLPTKDLGSSDKPFSRKPPVLTLGKLVTYRFFRSLITKHFGFCQVESCLS